MKTLISFITLTFAFSAVEAVAQTLSINDLRERGEISHHKGYIPNSLESMVGSSTIIVKGRFGELITNRPFYGYTENGEDNLKSFMRKHDFDAAEALKWAIPLSEYEIIIDEVLMGDIESAKIIFRKFEPAPVDRALTHPDVDRIFFLVSNPDGISYGARGEASILSDVGGRYRYDTYVESIGPEQGVFIKSDLNFVETTEVGKFEQLLRQEITRQEN